MTISKSNYPANEELIYLQSAINLAMDFHQAYLEEYKEESNKSVFDWNKIKIIRHDMSELEALINDMNKRWDNVYLNRGIKARDQETEIEEVFL